MLGLAYKLTYGILNIRKERHHLERILLDAMYQVRERQDVIYSSRCLRCVSKSKSNKNWTLHRLHHRLLPFTLYKSWQIRSSIPPPRLAEFHIPQRSSFYSAPEGEECVRDQGTHCVYGVPRFFFISNFIVNSRSWGRTHPRMTVALVNRFARFLPRLSSYRSVSSTISSDKIS